MSNENPNWTKKELEIYLLIYCANANFSESKDEKRFIKSKSGSEEYLKMHREFEKDNDYMSIQKIQNGVENLNYSQAEKDQLFAEIKEMFIADGDTDILEANIFRGLSHLL
jgi:tRNA G10  N-methylase Trm11